jgi:O-antigen/teichoic acid export membrane protein
MMKLIDNILSTLAARIAGVIIALVSSIVLARFLGPEGRGLFALIILLPEWVRTLAVLGFEEANAVYAGLEPQGRRALVWQSAVIAGVVGGVSILGGIGFFVLAAPGSQILAHAALWLYLLSLATIPCRLVVDYWWAILRGMNRIFLLNTVEVGTKAAALILTLAFMVGLHLDVVGAVGAYVMVHVGSVALMVALLRVAGTWGRPAFDRVLWWRTVRFALPAHGATVAGYLNYRVDEIFIAVLLPPEQLGFYVIAVGLVERLWLLTGSVANALLPHLTNVRERDPALVAIIARHVMVWTAGACMLVFVLADVLVQALYSSAFLPTVSPLRWLLPGIFTLSIGRVLVAELLAREKSRYTLWASGASALINIVGNLILVPRMGIAGAALASSISYTALSCILIRFYLLETAVSWRILLPRRSDLLPYATLWRRPMRLFAPASGAPEGSRL